MSTCYNKKQFIVSYILYLNILVTSHIQYLTCHYYSYLLLFMQLNALTSSSSVHSVYMFLSSARMERWSNLSWLMFDLSQVFTLRMQLNDLSQVQLVTGTVNASWNSVFSVGNAISSSFFLQSLNVRLVTLLG